jgi:hypothetical protein
MLERTSRLVFCPSLPGQVDGASHVVHVEEEAAGTRLTFGAGTCLLANEADPSQLIASSSGGRLGLLAFALHAWYSWSMHT